MRFDLRRPTLSWYLIQFQQNFHQFPFYIYIYIYIYIGSSTVSFGFLPFSRQLPSKTEVSIYLSVFVFLFIKERNLTRLKRPYLSSVLCLSRVRERSLVYGDFQT